MCDPVTAAIIGGGSALLGTGLNFISGQNASSAANNAQQQSNAAQASAFSARQAAAQQQLQEQEAVNTKSAAQFDQNQAIQQTTQQAALTANQQALSNINQQQQQIGNARDTAIDTGVTQANAPALAMAQADQQAQQQGLNTQSNGTLAASNPLGGSSSGVTKDAMDARSAGASAFVKQYGDSQAKLGSYAAPISLAGVAATGIGTNLMPAQAIGQMVNTGAPALLAPSNLAYQQAGALGSATQQANQISTSGALGLAGTQYANATDLANLGQQDTDAAIQTNLNQQQASDAAISGIGSGLAGLGSMGLQIGAANGAFGTSLFGLPATVKAK